MTHTDTVCEKKAGSRIITSCTSFIYVCPTCTKEWRMKKPEGKNDIICNGEGFRDDNLKNPYVPPVLESEEEQERKRIKRLIRLAESGELIDPEELAFLEQTGRLKRITKYLSNE